MSIIFDAVYEGGVLKPAGPLPLKEHEKVRLTLESSGAPVWERILARSADASIDDLAKPPIDGASQHDHYLYGTSKRPE